MLNRVMFLHAVVNLLRRYMRAFVCFIDNDYTDKHKRVHTHIHIHAYLHRVAPGVRTD